MLYHKGKNKNMTPRKWTEDKLNEIKEKKKTMSASQIAKEYNTTKSSILGLLYRDKLKHGYVPPVDSKYTAPKNVW
jgi:NADH:ubiquinone oxidoreductase subunit E